MLLSKSVTWEIVNSIKVYKSIWNEQSFMYLIEQSPDCNWGLLFDFCENGL